MTAIPTPPATILMADGSAHVMTDTVDQDPFVMTLMNAQKVPMTAMKSMEHVLTVKETFHAHVIMDSAEMESHAKISMSA
jgi:hypothetical protein